MIDGFSRPPDSLISGSKPRDGYVAQRYISNEPASDGVASLADNVSYDILIHFDDGDRVVGRCKPANGRPEVEIYPAPIGSPVTIHWKGDQMAFTIIEQPKYEECTAVPPESRPENIISRALRFLGV